MHMYHILQCTTQNRNVHISVLSGALWDMGQVDCVIREFGLLIKCNINIISALLESSSWQYLPRHYLERNRYLHEAYLLIYNKLIPEEPVNNIEEPVNNIGIYMMAWCQEVTSSLMEFYITKTIYEWNLPKWYVLLYNTI